ncbi:MAG: PEP-CTERM sorting domain-containing protein [Armatimonadetes bacterium]|nr:PEP-CTERM sorting domain-containing protein [Armatimonadota bacterium]
MNKHLNLLFVAGGILATSTSFGQMGPNSTYYLGAGNNLWTIQGTSDASAPTVTNGEFNLAVDGDIRTTQFRNSGDGQQYTLGLSPTGTTYSGTWSGIFDGTTDGRSNYTIDWDSSRVLSYDRNWQGEQTMFTLGGGGSGEYLGITYDGSGGLYVSQWNGGMIEHYTMGGQLLGSFDTGFTNLTALAMDYSTGTLWVGSQQHQGQFDEYTTSGTHLDTVIFGDMVVANTLGGEFDLGSAVPEPASLAVLGFGALALLRRKRAK